jgi:hypothetical protein
MNSFYQIASGHVHPLLIIELLKSKEKKLHKNMKCHKGDEAQMKV